MNLWAPSDVISTDDDPSLPPLPRVCASNTSPCVRPQCPRVCRHHAHKLKHACARHTRRRFGRTHGDALSGRHTVVFSVSHTTPQHKTQHNTTRHYTTQHQHNTTPHGDRDRDRHRERRGDEREEDKTRKERREDSFSVWWCMAVLC